MYKLFLFLVTLALAAGLGAAVSLSVTGKVGPVEVKKPTAEPT